MVGWRSRWRSQRRPWWQRSRSRRLWPWLRPSNARVVKRRSIIPRSLLVFAWQRQALNNLLSQTSSRVVSPTPRKLQLLNRNTSQLWNTFSSSNTHQCVASSRQLWVAASDLRIGPPYLDTTYSNISFTCAAFLFCTYCPTSFSLFCSEWKIHLFEKTSAAATNAASEKLSRVQYIS